MKYKYINYIVEEFQKIFPHSDTKRMEDILYQASDSEVYRVANAIERFGLENIISDFD